MKEQVHLSFGGGNHLHTHLYNAQESYMSFDAGSSVDPHALFQVGQASYSPRAVFWDIKGNLGAMSARTADSGHVEWTADRTAEAVWPTDKVQTIHEPRIAKHEYQRALDSLVPVESVSASTIRYWTDYMTLLLPPRSVQTLPHWRADKGRRHRLTDTGTGTDTADTDTDTHPPFVGYENGVAEYARLNAHGDYLDETVRPILEECDSLAALNIATDLDSAWSAFSTALAVDLKDNFVHKCPLVVWTLADSGPVSLGVRVSRVRSMLDALDTVSMLVPLAASPYSDLYRRCGQYALVHESASLLSRTHLSMQSLVSFVVPCPRQNLVSASVNGLQLSALYFSPPAQAKCRTDTNRMTARCDMRRDISSGHSGHDREHTGHVRKDTGPVPESQQVRDTYCITPAFNLTASFPKEVVSGSHGIRASLVNSTGVAHGFRAMAEHARFLPAGDRSEYRNAALQYADAYPASHSSDEDD